VKKRLAILIYSLAAGGAERVVSTVLPYLQNRFNVTLVLMNETIFYPVPEGMKVVYLERSEVEEAGWKKLMKLPWLGWRYARWLRENDIDTSWSLMSRPNYVNILAKIFGSPSGTVISERAMPSLQYGYPGLASWINRQLIRSLYPKADLILANSAGNRSDLIRHFGIPESKISVVYNPFDLKRIETFCMDSASVQKKERLFTFVTVGRLDEGKNHRMILEAFAKLKERNTRLLIIGEGPLRSELESLARRRGLWERVSFLGRQSNPFAYMAAADCFLFASRHEGFPNVLVEALACGLPVISTDCPSGPREILDERQNYDEEITGLYEARYGWIVPVDDVDAMEEGMERVYNNTESRAEISKRARERARTFDTERMVPKFCDLLESAALTQKGTGLKHG
jgi:N-acetylgalactosamine-N,N'-diacetylbacillosaminyl-diphospho-undecaprenol 4-alpha-N-acetylgalactosaminyltransferase